MEIRTKFNVGDKICVIDYFEKWKVKWVNVKITGIEIKVQRKNKIVYNIDSLIYGGYNEEYCFATKKEAQKECNRRNNENSITK